MNVSKYLNWWSKFFNDDWLCCEYLCNFGNQFEDVLPLAWEIVDWSQLLTLFWLQERFQKDLAKLFVRVFVILAASFLLGIQFLWLFSQFVN